MILPTEPRTVKMIKNDPLISQGVYVWSCKIDPWEAIGTVPKVIVPNICAVAECQVKHSPPHPKSDRLEAKQLRVRLLSKRELRY